MSGSVPPTGPPDGRTGLRLERGELRRRALAGVVVVFGRGAAIAVIGLLGQLVLARLLLPTDFGAVTFGLAAVAFVNLFADGGLGAGLIRRPEPPQREELEALSALQVGIALMCVLLVAAVAVPVGHLGWVTTLIVGSAPLLVLQIPGRIVLERDLLFDKVARVEVLQVLSFNLWAVALVLLGAGVWGLASAPLFRSVVGVVAMARVSPVGIPRLRFSWSRIRALMRFGVRFQLVTALWLVREQGLNMGIGAVAGTGALGLVSLARRLLEVPNLALQALWRVSFPAISQLVARGEPMRAQLERAVAVCAAGLGLCMVGLAASAPGLVPGLFGAVWAPAALLLPAGCLGLGVAGSLSVSCQGYLYAVDDAAAVLRAGVWQTLVAFAVTFALLPSLGIRAVALGWLSSYLVEAGVMARAAARHSGARLIRALSPALLTGAVSGAAGWSVTNLVGTGIAGGMVGGLSAVLLMVLLMSLAQRGTVLEVLGLVRSALGAVRRPGAGAAG